MQGRGVESYFPQGGKGGTLTGHGLQQAEPRRVETPTQEHLLCPSFLAWALRAKRCLRKLQSTPGRIWNPVISHHARRFESPPDRGPSLAGICVLSTLYLIPGAICCRRVYLAKKKNLGIKFWNLKGEWCSQTLGRTTTGVWRQEAYWACFLSFLKVVRWARSTYSLKQTCGSGL